MKQPILTLICTAAAILASLGAVKTSQPLPWNPPCANARIINYTSCTADLNLRTTTGITLTYTVPPCSTIMPPIPTGTSILGVITQAGNSGPLLFPGPIAPAGSPCGPVIPAYSAPANAWTPGVTLGPSPGCCFDVYFYRNTDPNYSCTIALFPGTSPCTP